LNRFTLPKIHLLKTTREFQSVYRQGQRLHGKGFAVIYLPNAERYNRLGISVQRKTGNAVRRNRIKRLIREVFRLHRDVFPSSCDIVFTVRPEFAIDSLIEMQARVTRLFGGEEQAGG
jgi:ribonuclease P protein component